MKLEVIQPQWKKKEIVVFKILRKNNLNIIMKIRGFLILSINRRIYRKIKKIKLHIKKMLFNNNLLIFLIYLKLKNKSKFIILILNFI